MCTVGVSVVGPLRTKNVVKIFFHKNKIVGLGYGNWAVGGDLAFVQLGRYF